MVTNYFQKSSNSVRGTSSPSLTPHVTRRQTGSPSYWNPPGRSGTDNSVKHVTRRGGFTLIELLVSMVILLILATLAISAFNGTSDRDRVSAATRAFQSAIEGARSKAIHDSNLSRSDQPAGIRLITSPNDGRIVTSCAYIGAPPTFTGSGISLYPLRSPIPTGDLLVTPDAATSNPPNPWFDLAINRNLLTAGVTVDVYSGTTLSGRKNLVTSVVVAWNAYQLYSVGAIVVPDNNSPPVNGPPLQIVYQCVQANNSQGGNVNTGYSGTSTPNWSSLTSTWPSGSTLTDGDLKWQAVSVPNIWTKPPYLVLGGTTYYTPTVPGTPAMGMTPAIPAVPTYSYSLQLLPPLNTDKPAVIFPAGLCIDLDGSKVPSAWRPAPGSANTVSYSTTMDIMFSGQGTLLGGSLVTEGVVHFLITSIGDVERTRALGVLPASPTATSLPPLTSTRVINQGMAPLVPADPSNTYAEPPDQPRKDRKIVTLFTQSGQLSKSEVNATDGGGDRWADAPFTYAVSGREAK